MGCSSHNTHVHAHTQIVEELQSKGCGEKAPKRVRRTKAEMEIVKQEMERKKQEKEEEKKGKADLKAKERQQKVCACVHAHTNSLSLCLTNLSAARWHSYSHMKVNKMRF